MSRNFTFPKKNLRIAAGILLMLNTGCAPAMDGNAGIRFSSDPSENDHLKHIVFGRDKDSICKYAEADYTRQRYYVFWTGTPGEARFANYLAVYAKKRYDLIFIRCGCKNQTGAYYYNEQMTVLLSKAKKRPLDAIYAEAKDEYNKTLL
jgi:hypothetical protein